MSLRAPARLLLLALLAFPAGCSANPGRVMEAGPVREDATETARRARELWEEWEEAGGSSDQAVEAYRLMAAAVRGTPSGPARFERLVDATRYALEIGRGEGSRGETFVDSALTAANTLVAEDSSRVEGWYHRAVALGLVAGEDRLKGRDAMTDIRRDAGRAVEIDSSYRQAGPHRVLGALYLRAPGPPAGVGSLRRALRHLEAAVEIAPDHPENLLLLAEAYLEDERSGAARELLDRAERLLDEAEAGEETRELRQRLAELRERAGEARPPQIRRGPRYSRTNWG